MMYRSDGGNDGGNREPAKEVRNWNGIGLNISTRAGEPRFAFSSPMACDYGCVRGSWGKGLDGKSLDVYVVSDKPTVFRVTQVTPDGAIDEYKYVLGAIDFDEAVQVFLKHVPQRFFGVATPYSIAQLQDDMRSTANKDSSGVETLVRELESWIESENAYNSSVSLLSFNIENGDISGKFKDTWNNRIFAYNVQKNRIGYKPAIDLKRADGTDSVRQFALFSAGYIGSRNDASKGGKKPRCSAISYNCGSVCIPLQHTCWINGAGQQTSREGGSIESFTQGRIDKLRALAKYLESKGNNKWSRYGRPEDLKQIAKSVEEKRAGLFKSGVKTPSEMLAATIQKAFKSGNFTEARKQVSELASKAKSGAEVAKYLQDLAKVVDVEKKQLENKKTTVTQKAKAILRKNGIEAANQFYSEQWNSKLEKLNKRADDVVSMVAREFLYVNNPSQFKKTTGGVVNPDNNKKTGSLNEEQKTKILGGLEVFSKMVGVDTVDGKQLSVTVIDSKSKKAGRSFYRGGTSTVYMADRASLEVVIHEAAHWLEESDPKIHAKVRDFFERRTAGEKWQKLSKLTGNKNYRDDEVAKPDKWPRPYMGKKTKSDKNSEILSMGMEMMYKDPIGFAKKDPEYFAFMHDTLRGR